MNYSSKEMFKLGNNIDFDIQNLSLEQQRKEIQKYNPLHYVFGHKLVSQPWLTYKEIYGA